MAWVSESATGNTAAPIWSAATEAKAGEAAPWNDSPNTGTSDWEMPAQNGEVLIEPSMHADSTAAAVSGAGTGTTCRNCGVEGHFSRDCPEPRKKPDCHNCGLDGHSAPACPNDSVFHGACRACSKQGHRAVDCPDKPAEMCKNCGQEGHRVLECSNNRARDDLTRIKETSGEDAWNKLCKASGEKDLDDFRTAFWEYMKATPDTNYADMETAFRSHQFAYYLIAREKEISDTHDIMNFQGKLGMKYHLQFHSSQNPRRVRQSEGWPSSADENLERLLQAGEVVDKMVSKCSNCNELGHITKYCKAEREEREKIEIKCIICEEVGHRARDCTQPRVDRNACRNCKKSGHKATDCPEPRSAEGVECKRCNEVGHFAKDCPTGGSRACRNCDAEGHIAKECPEPPNPAKMTCRNCEKTGHSSRDCPEPKDWSKVQCNLCQEFGHTVRRCPKAKDESSTEAKAGGDFENTADANGTTSADGTANEWNNIPAATEGVSIWGV